MPGAEADTGDRPAGRRWVKPGAMLILILILAILSIAPRLFDVATTQDACVRVEQLLSSASPETLRAEPVDWMPTRVVAGYQITLDRPTTLAIIVASRRNPEESRIELVQDGFVDGYEQSWESSSDHVEFGAQRFATGEQVSWVSGTTRILVFVDHPAPPPDHARVESLVELIPIR